MTIDILTLFPEMLENALDQSIIGRARKAGIVNINCTNIRDFAENKHNRVDDYPYGGGNGMVMQPGPIYRAYKNVADKYEEKPYVVYMSPQGRVFNQKIAKEFLKKKHIVILCGHYEGVDERIIEEIVDEEISIGDYVLTGGELPALVVCDCVSRMIPGVLSNEECFSDESHYNGRLEYPQYTRPPVFMGRSVPDVLLSGHHLNIEKWRLEQSELRTKLKRPDMIKPNKTGILGGSFNPIHNGHLFVAEKVKKMLDLDRVIFIPTGIAPHKDNGEFVSKEHRFNMVNLAVEDKFEVSDIEVKTNKVCYTLDTMSKLKKIYKDDELYYIIGGDSLANFMQWREPLKLFEMLHLVVVDRKGADIEKIAEEYRQKYNAKITICHIGEYDISSSEIRNNIRQGKDTDMIPEKVKQYIIEHRLYTEENK